MSTATQPRPGPRGPDRDQRAPTCGGSATPPPRRRSRSSRWRALVLIGVHVVIAAHLVHWAVAGRTISPVEPSESMFFLERGELNAGVLFFGAAILSTLVFGRFFCGWGCHIVALQDLCGWFMKKLGIRPRLFRSRLLVYVPLLLALYMFVWPSFLRWVAYPALRSWWPSAYGAVAPLPPLPEVTNHLLTEDFWATFASPLVAIPFLLVCGFATVYFLGAKGFCTYGCPYGGFFAPVDRLAFGQILADLDVCEKCGHCTATCTSNVRVHEEIQQHGKVVSVGCMKCLDCVSVCPTGALSYGFARPRLFSRSPAASRGRASRPQRRYDLTWPEEIGLAAFFAATFWAVRGLYASVPMLFAIGIAGCATFLAWKLWRLLRDRNVSLYRFALKRAGRLRPAGLGFVGLGLAGLLLLVHSGVVKSQLAGAEQDHREVGRIVSLRHLLAGLPADYYPDAVREQAARSVQRYQRTRPLWAGGWGLLPTPGIDATMARMALASGDRDGAKQHWVRAQAADPRDETAYLLARLEALSGRVEEAEARLLAQLAAEPDSPDCRRELAALYRGAEPRRPELAVALYRERLMEVPDDLLARCRLAIENLVPLGRPEEARAELRAALDRIPPGDTAGNEREHVVRDSLLAYARQAGNEDETTTLLEEALGRQPGWLPVRRELAWMRRARDERPAAETLFRERLAERPDDHAARILLATEVLLYFGDLPAARQELLRVVEQADDLSRGGRSDLDAAVALLVRATGHRGDLEAALALADRLEEVHVAWTELPAAHAELLARAGRGDDARAIYEQALERRPHDAHLRARYGIGLLLASGRTGEAVEQLERAVESAPHDGLVRADLALAHYRNGATGTAAEVMEEAWLRQPHHVPTVQRFIELLDLAGRSDEADPLRHVLPLLQRGA